MPLLGNFLSRAEMWEERLTAYIYLKIKVLVRLRQLIGLDDGSKDRVEFGEFSGKVGVPLIE
jgi:hypothetical protein